MIILEDVNSMKKLCENCVCPRPALRSRLPVDAYLLSRRVPLQVFHYPLDEKYPRKRGAFSLEPSVGSMEIESYNALNGAAEVLLRRSSTGQDLRAKIEKLRRIMSREKQACHQDRILMQEAL